MKRKKKLTFKFPADDKIRAAAHELVWQLFGVSGAMITNESLLEDFAEREDIPDHTWRRFATLSEEEKKRYGETTQQLARDWSDLLVWYPPLTDAEQQALVQKEREVLMQRIAAIYGVVIPEILAG